MDSDLKLERRPPAPDRRRDADFAERVGRELTSAADLLARLGKKQLAEAPRSAATDKPHWNVEELARVIAGNAARFLGADSLDPNSDFFEHGGTSVHAVELLASLSRELGIQIALDDLFADARPRRLAERWLAAAGKASSLLAAAAAPPNLLPPGLAVPQPSVAGPLGIAAKLRALGEQERSPHAEDDLQAIDADLSLANALPWVGPVTLEPPRRILLTGSTGFLGSHVLFDLLRRSDAHVVCLVRAPDEAQARARLAEGLDSRELPWSNELQRRISILCGDIAAPRFGLGQERWLQLAHEIDCIVNVAAAVDFMRGYRSLRTANVLGPLTAAALASEGPIKSLHHVSTISIFDELGIRSLGEDDPPPHVDRLFAGYETSKWAAEAILRRARDRGLSVSIYRPGGIVGHTVTGVYNPHDLSSGFMAAWQALRAVPEFRHMHAAPVDWVSRTISEMVLDPSSWGHNYHVTGEPITLRRLARDMSLGGMNVRVVGFEAWCEQFFERMQRDPIPNLDFLVRAMQSPATLHLVKATLNAPAARAERTESFLRRRKLPRWTYDPRSTFATTERLVRDGRARLPGREDAPYLQFRETMGGELSPLAGGEAVPCTTRLVLSVASFYQLLRERRVDVHGRVECASLHSEPLEVESGDCWFRPDDGVPERHGLEHPVMRYVFVARTVDGARYRFEGSKLARPGVEQWRDARTLYVRVSREGEDAHLGGELVVPPDSFVPDQVDGIEVSTSAPAHERGLAKLFWLIWFNAQFTRGFSEPLLRALVQLLDAARGVAFQGAEP
jgi:thioester reductase-like protein